MSISFSWLTRVPDVDNWMALFFHLMYFGVMYLVLFVELACS